MGRLIKDGPYFFWEVNCQMKSNRRDENAGKYFVVLYRLTIVSVAGNGMFLQARGARRRAPRLLS